VLSSILSWVTYYPDRDFSHFSPVPTGKCRGSISTHDHFLPNPLQLTNTGVDKIIGTLRNGGIEFVCVGYIERT
jgi:hypothetical protein